MSEDTSWKDPCDRIRLAGDLNRFAFKLFNQLSNESLGSIFLSPSSISTALAMTIAGSGGQTREELTAALGLSLSEEKLHAAFREISDCTLTGGVDFRFANRLWGQCSYNFLSEFLRTTREYYGAELEPVDFKNDTEAARHHINTWVAEQTEYRIQNIIPAGCLSDLMRLVLTNAVYFLGTWHSPFEEENTHEADFFDTSESTSKVSMMHQVEWFDYAETKSFQALKLPYKSYGVGTQIIEIDGESCELACEVKEEGSNFSMIVLLPKISTNLNQLTQEIATEGIQRFPQYEYREVRVFLPKLRLESEFTLSDTLQKFGLKKALSREEANFSRMSDNPEGLFISEILHKAFVEINEEGTEAAASTAICMVGGMAAPPAPPIDFRADRPFVFLIQDTATNLIHFIGRYMGANTL